MKTAVQYFATVLETGDAIHPCLEAPGFPNHFSQVMLILLLNFTKHGLQNLEFLRGISSACKNQMGAKNSHLLFLDFVTPEKLLHQYLLSYHTNFVMLRQQEFDFITCSGVHLKNKINAYIRPFDWLLRF